MKAMILAAGRGSRLRPLTDRMPKPLLDVAGQPLIAYHLEQLAAAGIKDVVINVAYLPELFTQMLGTGKQYGVNIHYSVEPEGGLETGGGIYNALPLLGAEPFIGINADIYTDFDYTKLPQTFDGLAHLVLVDHPEDMTVDFGLRDGLVCERAENMYTWSGIAVYKPALFADCQPGFFSTTPLLRAAMAQRQVSGEHYPGDWFEIGTPTRLEKLRQILSGTANR